MEIILELQEFILMILVILPLSQDGKFIPQGYITFNNFSNMSVNETVYGNGIYIGSLDLTSNYGDSQTLELPLELVETKPLIELTITNADRVYIDPTSVQIVEYGDRFDVNILTY